MSIFLHIFKGSLWYQITNNKYVFPVHKDNKMPIPEVKSNPNPLPPYNFWKDRRAYVDDSDESN